MYNQSTCKFTYYPHFPGAYSTPSNINKIVGIKRKSSGVFWSSIADQVLAWDQEKSPNIRVLIRAHGSVLQTRFHSPVELLTFTVTRGCMIKLNETLTPSKNAMHSVKRGAKVDDMLLEFDEQENGDPVSFVAAVSGKNHGRSVSLEPIPKNFFTGVRRMKLSTLLGKLVINFSTAIHVHVHACRETKCTGNNKIPGCHVYYANEGKIIHHRNGDGSMTARNVAELHMAAAGRGIKVE